MVKLEYDSQAVNLSVKEIAPGKFVVREFKKDFDICTEFQFDKYDEAVNKVFSLLSEWYNADLLRIAEIEQMQRIDEKLRRVSGL